MCCSSAAAKSPMAEFLKSQSPQELWKAGLNLKRQDPFKPADPGKAANPFDPASALKATTAPGTGLVLDTTA